MYEPYYEDDEGYVSLCSNGFSIGANIEDDYNLNYAIDEFAVNVNLFIDVDIISNTYDESIKNILILIAKIVNNSNGDFLLLDGYSDVIIFIRRNNVLKFGKYDELNNEINMLKKLLK